jgi:hypothetical protein
MGKRMAKMLLSNLRGSQTLGMTSDLMELFGLRRRRKNGSVLPTIIGAGALAYSMKKMMDNQQLNGGKKQNPQMQSSTTKLSTDRKSAIKNIVNSYSKNDPGLRAALQEISAELGQNESETNQESSNRTTNIREAKPLDWDF